MCNVCGSQAGVRYGLYWDARQEAWVKGKVCAACREDQAASRRYHQWDRRRAARRWKLTPEQQYVRVTAQDSLDAGNCRSKTKHVASWWPEGTEYVLAYELRAMILQRAPVLWPFAHKAIEQAVKRAKNALDSNP